MIRQEEHTMDDFIGQNIVVDDAVAIKVPKHHRHPAQLVTGRIKKLLRKQVLVGYMLNGIVYERRIDPSRNLVKIPMDYYVAHMLMNA
jgi:hypothetical protein